MTILANESPLDALARTITECEQENGPAHTTDDNEWSE